MQDPDKAHEEYFNVHLHMSPETREAINGIKTEIKEIKENHLHDLKEGLDGVRGSLFEMKVSHEGVRKDVCWLKKFFWIIATASVGSLIAGIMQLLMV